MLLFAIKNIWRYKYRSLLTISVIMASAFSSVLVMGVMNGLFDSFIDNFVKYETGHIKISTKKYDENSRFNPIYENITNSQEFATQLELDDRIDLAVPMIKFNAFLGNEGTTIPIMVIAMDLHKNTYDFDKHLKIGHIPDKGMLIGQNLLDKINDQVGSTPLIVSVTVDGGMNAAKPVIEGVYKFGRSQLDSKSVFIDLQTSEKLLRSGDATTLIYLYLKDEKYINKVAEELQTKYPNLSIKTYKEQIGYLYDILNVQKKILGIITMFIMLLGSFVIINSLIASIYERMSEFGMLKAIGFNDKELSLMLFYEGFIFSFIGGSIGFCLGSITVYIFSKYGLYLGKAMEKTSIPIGSVFYPHLTLETALLTFVIIVITPLLVSLYPGRYLSKISPIKALNYQN